MKATPGPWKVVGTEIWGAKVRIASGRGAYDEKDREIKKGNARLIAAAPELLEGYKELVKLLAIQYAWSEEATMPAWYKKARVIIAKAERGD